MNARHVAIAALALAATAVPAANATVFQFNVALSGLQEVPPTPSQGTGNAVVTADDASLLVTINGTFQGLLGPATAAHLHGLAPAGVNAGILFGLNIAGNTINGQGVLSAANFNGLMNNLTYINIHTTVFPGGEIRGQVITPAPAGFALLGAAGLFGRRRRV